MPWVEFDKVPQLNEGDTDVDLGNIYFEMGAAKIRDGKAYEYHHLRTPRGE